MTIESVPNFSEGRNAPTVRAIAAAMGDCVLDYSLDPDHHRSVITAAATPPVLLDAVCNAAAKAVELIDLRTHHGVHPRFGALDVLPFIPLEKATVDDCVELARHAGHRLWTELRLPVYFYEAAARSPARQSLARLRQELRANPHAIPDIGDPAPHPTAGVVIVGARFFLIAYNVNLESTNLAAAKTIAAAVRRLPGVRALGLYLASAQTAQVSMNLIDFRKTGIAAAFDAVCRQARELGIEVRESELIGLAPAAALTPEIAAYVRLRDFHPRRILPVK